MIPRMLCVAMLLPAAVGTEPGWHASGSNRPSNERSVSDQPGARVTPAVYQILRDTPAAIRLDPIHF